ncbi:CDP-glycerol glycerophosphotransferase, TagB/SpsB family [Methanobrevibacter gottschalkii]|uniref:CDP-glycerol glycerophosphotransferase, TagB/SpsB family n=1 Tax=Methanobrevibacter gottschalkii TaxID=190974 RepID=A0A1H7NE75_9EURY|nr:CDP-glycerol glycerophosphotransferase family protein [Methanobrevibacter gottschalkii]SEL21599.1 CDP-glycerol glycerophosphotransferase, TagB/SpsB family [Methanobrevibacter gottschalkii]
MADNFKFSIIVSNLSGYKDSIDSIISQELDFRQNVQLIILKDNNNITLDIDEYITKYPNNILVLENKDNLNSRNFALRHASGEFINFMKAGDTFDKSCLKTVSDLFNNNTEINLVSIALFDPIYKNIIYKTPLSDERLIDINTVNNKEFNYYFHLPIYASFIRGPDYYFEDKSIDENGISVTSKILIDDNKFGFIKDIFCYHKTESEFSENINYSNVMGKLKLLYDLIQYADDNLNKNPEFLQHIIAKELEYIVKIEDLDQISTDLNKLNEFWNLMDTVLKNVSKKAIKSNNFLDNFVISFLLFIKNKSFAIDCSQHKVFFKTENYSMLNLHNQKLYFDVIEIKKGILNLSGYLKSICYSDNITVEALLKDKNDDVKYYKGKFVEYPTTNRKTVNFLSNPWIFSYNFDFKIPLNEKKIGKISFRTLYHENSEYVIWNNKISPRKYSNLSKFSHYLVKDDMLVLLKDNSIYSMSLNAKSKYKFDLRAIFQILKERPQYYRGGIFYRTLMMLLYPFWKNRKIWMFMDRPDFADDNGEHLFKYALNQKDDVDKYYVLDKNASDFKRLSKSFKNVIAFGSFKHKLLFLFSQKIITSQPAVSLYNPFFSKNITMFAGFYPNVYFLQHGVTKDNVSSWLHKFNRNLSLISTTSDLEKKSFLDVGYNYDEDIIQTLGFTRYDNLNGENTKKQIVIMPTWRNYIKNEDDLKNSEYFKRWNSLINNNEFIEYAGKKGYEIIFKPHPNLYKFIDLFDKNDHVIIDYVKKYQEIFNESALLITDYSSIFFDFAYIKKPLIFYQYANDYHFDSENGYFNYESMGFGEVIKNEEDIVNKIKYYLDNDCVMEDLYRKRVDDFFKYTDRNNCMRTYEWIYKN